MFKKSLVLILIVTLLSSMACFANTGQNANIYVYTYDEYATDNLTVKFRVNDDSSLKNGFVAIFAGNPHDSGAISLLAEQITDNSSDITMVKTFAIDRLAAKSSQDIYILVLDADGNETLASKFTIQANFWDAPVHTINSPSLDTSSSCDITYTGYKPVITTNITITDYTSNNYTCKLYFNSVSSSETLIDSKSISGSNFSFASINLSNYPNGFYNLKTMITDNEGHTIENFRVIELN